MYSICVIAYGVPLTDKVMEHISGVDPENFGFTTLYHGAAVDYTPGYCGVAYHEFDESTHVFQRWADFVNEESGKLTEEMKQEAQAKFDALEPEIKAALAEEGITQCDSFIIWCTS